MLEIFLEFDIFFENLGVIIELTGHLKHSLLNLFDLFSLPLQLQLLSLSQLHLSHPSIDNLIPQPILQFIVLSFVPSRLLLFHNNFCMHPLLFLLHLLDPGDQHIVVLLQMDQHLRVILIDIHHRRCRDDRLDIRHLSPYSPHRWQAIIVIIDASKPAIFPKVIRTLLVIIKKNGVVDVIVVFIIDGWTVLRDGVGVNYGVLGFWVGWMVLIGEQQTGYMLWQVRGMERGSGELRDSGDRMVLFLPPSLKYRCWQECCPKLIINKNKKPVFLYLSHSIFHPSQLVLFSILQCLVGSINMQDHSRSN